MATLILTKEFRTFLEQGKARTALSSVGYSNIEDFEKQIIDRLNKAHKELNIKSISYHELRDTDTYIGVILDNALNKIYNVCVVPPVLGTRSGFITQQVFGFISNLIILNKNINSYTFTDKPVIIVNCLVQNDLPDSSVCNVISAKVMGFEYIDIFNRREDFGTPYNTLIEYYNTISQHKDSLYKDLIIDGRIVTFRTERLKGLKETLTNEPYYFAIDAYPALLLAGRENYTIDLSDFKTWYDNVRNNKNIEAFCKAAYSMQILNVNNVLLYGPPGTGKTYEMQHKYIDKFNEADRFVTTFHQSFTYEEFVEGLKASTKEGKVNYYIEKGIFYKACDRAAQLAGYQEQKDDNGDILSALDVCLKDTRDNRKDKFQVAPTVLMCIDEINRANVSAVFGDLISLIETSKRLGAGENEMTAILPYSKKKFGVPANLMIVGTMNTADRSIQLLDSALRRRFEFKELLPQLDKVENANAQTILKNINLNICAVLNKDHQIGHSYFIGVKDNKDIVRVMMTQVIPLLEEYFYNNTDKIKSVLGERNATVDCFYVEDKEVSQAFKNCSEGEDRSFYKLNEDYLSPNITEEKATEIVKGLIKHLEGRI